MTYGGEQKQKILFRFTNTFLFSFLLYIQNSFSLKIITLISLIQFFNVTPLVYVSTNFYIIWSFQGLWKCHLLSFYSNSMLHSLSFLHEKHHHSIILKINFLIIFQKQIKSSPT